MVVLGSCNENFGNHDWLCECAHFAGVHKTYDECCVQ